VTIECSFLLSTVLVSVWIEAVTQSSLAICVHREAPREPTQQKKAKATSARLEISIPSGMELPTRPARLPEDSEKGEAPQSSSI
jgi:hypothetical protein